MPCFSRPSGRDTSDEVLSAKVLILYVHYVETGVSYVEVDQAEALTHSRLDISPPNCPSSADSFKSSDPT